MHNHVMYVMLSNHEHIIISVTAKPSSTNSTLLKYYLNVVHLSLQRFEKGGGGSALNLDDITL